MATSAMNPVDVLVIGSGPAGLHTVLSLSRLLHTCIVFSSPTIPNRNHLSKHMHGLATWEHRDAADYRAAARRDILDHYDTARFEDVEITKIENVSGGTETKTEGDGAETPDVEKTLFKATDDQGVEWWGRKLVLASGVKDIMLDIEGYEECWATGIFHCLFCHGYSERNSPSAGVLAIDNLSIHSTPSNPSSTLSTTTPPTTFPLSALAVHSATFALRLASHVTIYTNGDEATSTGVRSALSAFPKSSRRARDISLDERRIVKLVKLPRKAEVEITFADEKGEEVDSKPTGGNDTGTDTTAINSTNSKPNVKVEAFLAHKPDTALNGPWVQDLGLAVTDAGDVKVNGFFNETSVRGVFCAGDAGTLVKSVTGAIAMGGMVAAGIASQLGGED